LRTPAEYAAPAFHDPEDLRLVQVIKKPKDPAPGGVNILGVPYDGAVLGRRGAAEGPASIRLALSAFSTYSLELGEGLEEAMIADLGDVSASGEVEEVHREVESEIAASLRKDSLLAILGGDNSVSLPALTACAKKLGKIGLVVIDSHLDLRGKIQGKPTNGSSYGLAISAVPGLGARTAEVGVHGFLNSRKYALRAQSEGVEVLPAEEVRKRGMGEVIGKAYRKASEGADSVYFSMDLDAVDLSQVSGVSSPSAGGIMAADLFDAARFMGSMPKVHCADLVELAPSLDPTGSSQRVAATALVYLIAGFVSRSSSHR
jgi:formiminoglutamase